MTAAALARSYPRGINPVELPGVRDGFVIGASRCVYGYPNPMSTFVVVLLIAIVTGVLIGPVSAAMNGVKTWDEFLLMVLAGGIGGALAAYAFYLFAVGIGIAGAAARADFAFWATVVWSGLGLIGALLTPTLDKHENRFTNSLSLLLKWTHSPILTTVGIFVMIVAAIVGSKVGLRKGMIFVEVGQGSDAITIGAIGYAQTGGGNWGGNQPSDLLAQHESVHGRAFSAVGELGFYVTYLAVGLPWGAIQGGGDGMFGLNDRGCGNPLEKLASEYWDGQGGQQPQESASPC